ncbi:hypothetical protein EDB85DRAFT_1888658 [Lactarius pseudohatsudake]|nr:hypothetical protein EDB85DRAFT_1888658 [Lactarius pseudohatsudake]
MARHQASVRSSPPLQSATSSTTPPARPAKKADQKSVTQGLGTAALSCPSKSKKARLSSTASSIADTDGGKDSPLIIDADTEEEKLTEEQELEQLQTTWRSAVYGFFKTKVHIGYDQGHKFHFFQCAAQRCKGSGGVR